MADSKGKNLVVGNDEASSVPSVINLTPTTQLDLSWQSEAERRATVAEYQKGMLDIARKAQEMNVDAIALRNTLNDLATTTKEVSETGNAVTVTHTQTTSIGRTEIIMGNTAQAQTGKLSRSQTGESDQTGWYIFGGVVALIVIIAILAK